MWSSQSPKTAHGPTPSAQLMGCLHNTLGLLPPPQTKRWSQTHPRVKNVSGQLGTGEPLQPPELAKEKQQVGPVPQD